jgi:hypothetical protein
MFKWIILAFSATVLASPVVKPRNVCQQTCATRQGLGTVKIFQWETANLYAKELR